MADNELNPSEELEGKVENESQIEVSEEVAKERLSLQTQVESRSSCERHITVTVSRADIDRFMDKEFDELAPEAQIPGFRPGRAPRKLLELRFRKDVAERVKSAILVEALSQVNEDENLAPISDPDIDINVISIPESGDFTFEYDLEVRPEFEVPQWKGLKLPKPVRDFSDADVELALKNHIASKSELKETEEGYAAKSGDYITAQLTIMSNGAVLNASEAETICLRPQLLFTDATLENFDTQMEGVKGGETRTLKMTLSENAPNVALRGKEVEATFAVKEISLYSAPGIADVLEEFGVENEEQLHALIRDRLASQLTYRQEQMAREKVVGLLVESADWELPPALLERQSEREMYRTMLELQQRGFSRDQISGYVSLLRQNSRESTARQLKEHFILERIAENENLDVSEEDYDSEIEVLAMQMGDTPRRVRSRLEKQNQMDILRNQIIEGKVMQLILDSAEFEEVPYEMPQDDFATLDYPAGGRGEEVEETAEAEKVEEAEKAEEAEGATEA